MDQRITMITLGVDDLARARAFYEALGWTAHSSSQESIVFFQLPGMSLGLYGREALADDAKLPHAHSGFGGITVSCNYGSKEEVDAVIAQAAAAGATILKPAEDVFWGGYSGYFADPDGHPWEIAWNPFWPLNPDGTLTLAD